MDILKRLFGGGGSASGQSGGDKVGMYFYVQPAGCEEVVRVRIDRNNDPSLADDNSTYWVRKSVRGAKCRQTATLVLYFDSNRRLTNSEVTDGTLVDAAAYEAWMNKTE
jgi:hypothetical protein